MKILDKLSEELGDRIRINEEMRDHTTFKAGGSAEFYIDVDKIEDLVKTILLAKKLGIAYFLFGAGTNLIVSEKGIAGLVIKNNCRRFETQSMRGRVVHGEISMGDAVVFAEGGVIINQLVRYTIEQGLGGLEYQLGLPGTIGGALCMNANFAENDSAISDNLVSAKILDAEGNIRDVESSYFQFQYGYSYLQSVKDTLLSAVFELRPMDKALLWNRGQKAVTYRNTSSPQEKITGCTYRNIKVIQETNMFSDTISFAYLLKKAEIQALQVGDTKLSENNPHYILNIGNATANEVDQLVQKVKDELQKQFQVKLILSARTVGI